MNGYKGAVHGLVSAAVLAILAGGGRSQAPAKPAAVVNGEAITFAEVEAVLKRHGPTPTPLTEAQRRTMQEEVVNLLIDDVIMRQFLRKNGPRIDPAELNKRLAELATGLQKEGKTLQDFYKETGQDENQVRTSLLNMLQWAAYAKDKVGEAEVKRYYDENKEVFDEVQVRASHIVLRVAANAPDAERQAAAARLRALRQEIVAGKLDFAEAAKKNSQCPTAPGGGDVGYFPRKWVVEEPFAKAAFALKVGDVSDVVTTDYGVHLIKVTDRKPGQPSDYAKTKEKVREICVEEMRLALVEQQRKASQITINLP
jgi:peptidyl-prolyl cis-trans isomerase C